MEEFTDRQLFEEILRRNQIQTSVETDLFEKTNTVLTLVSCKSPLVTGYVGFCTQFTFNDDGKLMKIGLWE